MITMMMVMMVMMMVMMMTILMIMMTMVVVMTMMHVCHATPLIDDTLAFGKPYVPPTPKSYFSHPEAIHMYMAGSLRLHINSSSESVSGGPLKNPMTMVIVVVRY